MTAWRNLPCPPTLHAVSQLCPLGWLEVTVSYYQASTAGGIVQDADMSADIGRIWGVADEHVPELAGLLGALQDADGLAWSNKSPITVLVRVQPDIRRCSECKIPVPDGHEGFMCPKADENNLRDGCTGVVHQGVKLDARWGTDGNAVWTDDETPSLTPDQPAPRPGAGDMWATLIERYRGELRPEVIAMFGRRRALGVERYGTVLQAGNGRDAVADIVGETLDRIAYAEQIAHEDPEAADLMRAVQRHDLAFLGALALRFGDRAVPGSEATFAQVVGEIENGPETPMEIINTAEDFAARFGKDTAT